MPVTKTVPPGGGPLEGVVGAFEGLSFDYWNRRVGYAGNVHLIPKPKRPPQKLQGFGDLVYVGEPPFALDEKGWPLSNAGCLFLPGVVPEIPAPVFIACRVNHAEGFIAYSKAVERLRGSGLSPEEQIRLLRECYSAARIIGEGRPNFLVREDVGGAELAELGRLFAREYLRIPSDRVRIDVSDPTSREHFIREGKRYMLTPLYMSPREEVVYLQSNRGRTEHDVCFYYAPIGERYLTRDQLCSVVDDFKERGDGNLLGGRLGDILTLRRTMNEYRRVIQKEEVPELYYFEVGRRDTAEIDAQIENVLGKVGSGADESVISAELDGLVERYTAATPPEYHHCDPLENQLFRSDMIKTLRQLPHEMPYELRVKAVNPRSTLSVRLQPLLAERFGGHPMNIGLMLHSDSKRALIGDMDTGLVEWFDEGGRHLIHFRDSKFNLRRTMENFRRMPDGRISGRDNLDSRTALDIWEREGHPITKAEGRRVMEEYIQYRGDRITANRIYYRCLGDEEMTVESERLGRSSFWVRPFFPELIAVDKRPVRDHGDLEDAGKRNANIEGTVALNRSMGKVFCVNHIAAADPLTGTGDELFNPDERGFVRQTDATGGYRLRRLSKKITDDPRTHMMAAIFEMETELLSEIMGAGPQDLERIRSALLESFVSSQKTIEAHIPEVTDEVEKVLCERPRTGFVGTRFNLPKKIPISLARFIDSKRSDATELFSRLMNIQYADGSSVLNLDDPKEERILRLLDSARDGALYAKPEETAALINERTDGLLAVGRRLIARETSVENKSEVVDALVVALSVDCNRIDAALKILEDDAEFPILPIQEKLDRLRSLKLKRAVESASTRSIPEVEEYARECVRRSGAEIIAAEDLFAETLSNRFPGLNFTSEDATFFMYTILNPDRHDEYRRLGYC